MDLLDHLASSQNRKDNEPNVILAEELIKKGDKKSIKELVDNLSNKDRKIQEDCLAVLEQIGLKKPKLISKYSNEFLKLLKEKLNGKDNKLIWMVMIVLYTISDQEAEKIWKSIGDIIRATEQGSVISMDNGIKIMAKVSSKNKTFEKRLFPILLKYLKEARKKSVAQYTESIYYAVNEGNKVKFLKVIQKRKKELNKNQLYRVNKVLKTLEKEK